MKIDLRHWNRRYCIGPYVHETLTHVAMFAVMNGAPVRTEARRHGIPRNRLREVIRRHQWSREKLLEAFDREATRMSQRIDSKIENYMWNHVWRFILPLATIHIGGHAGRSRFSSAPSPNL